MTEFSPGSADSNERWFRVVSEDADWVEIEAGDPGNLFRVPKRTGFDFIDSPDIEPERPENIV